MVLEDKYRTKQMDRSRDIDILLIGKTGTGKSALGNTILGRNAFPSSDSVSSVTRKIAREVGFYGDRVIKVVDGPGVGDTRMNNEESEKLVVTAMKKAISANPKGYHAFLLVMKFNDRFTAEDRETIAFLKKLFGENFVKNFCILVLTRGDCFNEDEEGKTFEQWCDEQTGYFKELVDECCRRVLLIDNRAKDERLKEKQLARLIDMVDNLRWIDLRYTDANFQNARQAREKYIVETNEPTIQGDSMAEVSLIIQKLNSMEGCEGEAKMTQVEELKARVKTLHDNIITRDKGTGALKNLLATVESLQDTIDNEISLTERLIQEKEKIRLEEEEIQRLYDERIKKELDEYERCIGQEETEDERRKRISSKNEEKLREKEAELEKKREENKIRFNTSLEEKRRKQREKTKEIELKYRMMKDELEVSFLSKVKSVITLPFKKVLKIDE